MNWTGGFILRDQWCIRYIHIVLWVRKVVLNELDGWFHFKRPVGSLCIVPPVCRDSGTGREVVLHQADVELRVKEFILVSRQYTPPGGAIKAFSMGIHL